MQQEEKNAQLPRETVHRSRCCGKQQGFSNCEGCCVHARTSNFFFLWWKKVPVTATELVCWLVMCNLATAHCTVQAPRPGNNRNNIWQGSFLPKLHHAYLMLHPDQELPSRAGQERLLEYGRQKAINNKTTPPHEVEHWCKEVNIHQQ